MNLTPLIDVAIGLSLTYLGASLFVTIANESIAQFFNRRGELLARNLKQLISDDSLAQALARSPALAGFFRAHGRPASYVDTKMLAQLLIGAVRGANGEKDKAPSMTDVIKAISALAPSDLRKQLADLAQSAGGKVDTFVDNVAEWIDQSLTMLGESYKRLSTKWSFAVGLIAAVGLNIDTIELTTRLYKDKETRDAFVALAVEFNDTATNEALAACQKKDLAAAKEDPICKPFIGLIEFVSGRNETLGELPFGWNGWKSVGEKALPWEVEHIGTWFQSVAGWLLTAIAISLGAPFWFDLLNKLVNVRQGMGRPKRDGA